MSEIAWITTIDEKEASGDLAAAYAQIADRNTGRVGHLLKVSGLSPRFMLAHRKLFRTLMYGRSPLTRAQREMIGTVVSSLNSCHY